MANVRVRYACPYMDQAVEPGHHQELEGIEPDAPPRGRNGAVCVTQMIPSDPQLCPNLFT